MIIHFICRGNAFRSIIAEAYLNSLKIKDWIVLSSGTAAASEKARNLASYGKTLELLEKHGIREFAKADYGDQLTQSRLEGADITACMNQRVYGECLRYMTFRPARVSGQSPISANRAGFRMLNQKGGFTEKRLIGKSSGM